MNEKGKSPSEIAQVIGKHRSSIYRELKRNRESNETYCAKHVEQAAQKRHKEKANHHTFTPQMQKDVRLYIEKEQYSPEQIRGHSKRIGKQMVSHETIYQYIWNDKQTGGTLYTHLRRRGRKYNKRGSNKKIRGQIANRVSIKGRPKIVGFCENQAYWIPLFQNKTARFSQSQSEPRSSSSNT